MGVSRRQDRAGRRASTSLAAGAWTKSLGCTRRLVQKSRSSSTTIRMAMLWSCSFFVVERYRRRIAKPHLPRDSLVEPARTCQAWTSSTPTARWCSKSPTANCSSVVSQQVQLAVQSLSAGLEPQIPPLRFAPVGMTNQCKEPLDSPHQSIFALGVYGGRL